MGWAGGEGCIRGFLIYHFPMEITIDQAGRIVVPKVLRERFGLFPGTEMVIEAEGNGLRLRPREIASTFVEKKGVLVHHAEGPAQDIDVAAFINRERESRAHSGNPIR